MQRNDLVLVTGCTGYLGAWTAVEALKAGARVRGSMRNPKKAEFLVKLAEKMGKRAELELVTLDLLNSPDSAFVEAMRGVDFVLHTASPFPQATPKDENELIRPAVEGTLKVARAVDASPSVKRLVITSSEVAVHMGDVEKKESYDENDWSRLDGDIALYPKSKTMAEKAAWNFYRNERKRKDWTFSAVNPCFIMGPSLGPDDGTSMSLARRLMGREIPLVPDLTFSVVDVRDAAAAHVKVLLHPQPEEIEGRFITVARAMDFVEMGKVLSGAYHKYGYNPPTQLAPYFAMWFFSIFDKGAASILPLVGKGTAHLNGEKARRVLGMQYRDPKQSMIDMGASAIALKLVKQTSAFLKVKDEFWSPEKDVLA